MGFTDFYNENSGLGTAKTADIQAELRKRQGPHNVFPLHVFHDRISPFITELYQKYDIPRSYVGLSMLLSYSSAIGTAYAVTRNGSDRLYMSMWGCMNGMSSSGKSFALDTCLKPLNDLQDQFDEQYENARKGLTDDKILNLPLETVIYRDAYIPTLIRWIMPGNPKGVLKESDEILEWINGLNPMGKKESTDEQFWLSGWNGRKYSAVRSGNNKITIPRVFTNIIGGIQPPLLHKLFKNDRDVSGFIFRILFACPEEHRMAQPTPGYDIPYEQKKLHSDILHKLYKMLPVESGYENPKICQITKAATDLIIEWEREKINKINKIQNINEKNIHSGIQGKMKDYSYRFAGLLAVTDKAYQMTSFDDKFPDTISITSDIMQRALDLADYFYKSAVEVYETVDKTVTAPLNIMYMATLFKMGKSLSQMAELIHRDVKKKYQVRRDLQKAIQEYPKIFGAANH